MPFGVLGLLLDAHASPQGGVETSLRVEGVERAGERLVLRIHPSHRVSGETAVLREVGNPADVQRQKRKLSEGRSILDELLSQTKTLRDNASAADRQRLDEYFHSIRAAERDLAEAQSWLNKPKPQVEEQQPNDINDKTDLVGRMKLLMNLILFKIFLNKH